jgi:predicted amidohydrolase YtcJ
MGGWYIPRVIPCKTSRQGFALLVPAAVLAAAALLPSARLFAAAAADPADLVLRGGVVYTVDAARSWAQALAVKGGRLVYVGSDHGVAARIGPRTQVVDLGGRLVLPGFVDAHVHPVSGGVELGQCNLNDLPDAKSIFDKVRKCATEKPGPGWLVGGGWSLTAFPAGAPTRQELDAVVRERPVFLYSADGHSSWANTKALELAGVTRETKDPKDGRIERDAKGDATGTLRESAGDLVSRLLPKISLEERVAGLVRAVEHANRNGLTGLQEANAGGGPEGGGRGALEAYREAERTGRLNARVTVSLGTDASRGAEQVDGLIALRREFSADLVRPRAVKIFADGVIEAHTAVMLQPYQDKPADPGEPIWSDAALRSLVARLVREDFNVHVHAIGDRAVRMTLDAMEAARPGEGDRRPRYQIAHLELIHPADVPRFRALGVIANFQPLWAWADSYIKDLTWPVIGPERSRYLYPIGSVARSGAVLAFGSDWSVSSLNPLEGIQVAVTRQGLPGENEPPLLPEEAIDLPTAIAAYTIGAAYALDRETEIGSLEVGKAADLVVLSDNVFMAKPREIARAKVLLTLFGGRPVWCDPAFAF